jgi:hypothetical protein
MGTARFTPEFKEEAVKQVTERGYSVADVGAPSDLLEDREQPGRVYWLYKMM